MTTTFHQFYKTLKKETPFRPPELTKLNQVIIVFKLLGTER